MVFSSVASRSAVTSALMVQFPLGPAAASRSSRPRAPPATGFPSRSVRSPLVTRPLPSGVQLTWALGGSPSTTPRGEDVLELGDRQVAVGAAVGDDDGHPGGSVHPDDLGAEAFVHPDRGVDRQIAREGRADEPSGVASKRRVFSLATPPPTSAFGFSPCPGFCDADHRRAGRGGPDLGRTLARWRR